MGTYKKVFQSQILPPFCGILEKDKSRHRKQHSKSQCQQYSVNYFFNVQSPSDIIPYPLIWRSQTWEFLFDIFSSVSIPLLHIVCVLPIVHTYTSFTAFLPPSQLWIQGAFSLLSYYHQSKQISRLPEPRSHIILDVLKIREYKSKFTIHL